MEGHGHRRGEVGSAWASGRWWRAASARPGTGCASPCRSRTWPAALAFLRSATTAPWPTSSRSRRTSRSGWWPPSRSRSPKASAGPREAPHRGPARLRPVLARPRPVQPDGRRGGGRLELFRAALESIPPSPRPTPPSPPTALGSTNGGADTANTWRRRCARVNVLSSYGPTSPRPTPFAAPCRPVRTDREAEKHFLAALELNPRLYEALYTYARTCVEQGRLADAARLFERAAAAAGGLPEPVAPGPDPLWARPGGPCPLLAPRGDRGGTRHLERNPDDVRAVYLTGGPVLGWARSSAASNGWSARAP